MYAKCVLILLGIVLAAIAIESLSSRVSAPAIQLPPPGLPPDVTGLDHMIVDLDLRKTPLEAVFQTLAARTHTNITTNWKLGNTDVPRDVPISIHLQRISLATALRVIGDLVFGDAEDQWTLTYTVAPGGIITVGPAPIDDIGYAVATMEVIEISDLLWAENHERKADKPPRRPMLWIFRRIDNYPFYDFLQSTSPGLSAIIFGTQLVVYDTPDRARHVRDVIDAVRHPIDPAAPFPASQPQVVRRLSHFRLDNVPVAEAFEHWRQAVGVNAAVMLPRPRGYEGEKFPYDLRAPVTVDLHDVSAEDAAGAIVDNCVGYLGSLSVYHDDGIVYVRPTGKRPPGVLRLFNVSQLMAHPERWYRDDYAPARPYANVPEKDILAALDLALDDYDHRNTYWQGRLAAFGTSEELEKKARRLRAMLLQKSPDDYKPDPEPPANQ